MTDTEKSKAKLPEREMLLLVSGFCTGLSGTHRFDFDEYERKLLKTAGTALRDIAEALEGKP
jgi:hypothetical protein